MSDWRQYVSRIAIRLMAFNLLLVILPIAGILYLDIYEDHLVAAQERAMFGKAEVLAAAIETIGPAEEISAYQALLDRIETASDLRVRIVDRSGHVVADSAIGDPISGGHSELRRSWLYRVGSFLLRKPLRLVRPPENIPAAGEGYEDASVLRGDEIAAAFSGARGKGKRITSTNPPSVILYAAVPVERDEGRPEAVVLVSQSTIGILHDLYAVRIGIFQIFLVALVISALISLWIAATIVRPIRQLREEAGAILDRRGRLLGRFRGSTKRDEIGDLSRALERLTNRLEMHQEFSESFASDVSHEFKNPLASIRNATEMLSEVSDPADRRRFLRIVEREVARMEHLLSALRDVTLIDARLGAESRQTVDLVELVSMIVEGFDLRGGKGVSFDLEVAQDGAMVSASGERLAQVFENLLDNAVSFSPPGGTINVRLSRDGGSVVTIIEDGGPGFPSGHHGKVFDRFFTYRPDDSGAELHTGLGLAIVKAIVEGYGGSIILSNRESGGAIAEVRLPLA